MKHGSPIAMNRMEIDLRGISKRFGPIRALQGVDVHLSGGDLLVLTGPNGSGKSTLLRILATALSPDEGQYLWNGAPVTMKETLTEARKRIGYLGEATACYEDLSVEENLAFWAQIYGADTTNGFSQKLSQVLDEWSLIPQRQRPLRVLSQGMRKRLGLARLSLQECSVALLDEPFNGLDTQNTGVLQQQIIRWKKAGKIIAVATHQPEILKPCGKMIPVALLASTGSSKEIPEIRGHVTNSPLNLVRVPAFPCPPISPHFLILLRKDILLEWKAKDLLGFLFVFALSVILLFSFAWDVPSREWPNLAPGILWVTFLFAGVLSFQRGFAVEKENHCLEALLISPMPRSSLFLAKTLSSLLWLMLLGLIVYPVFFILHDLSFWGQLPKLFLVHAVGNAGFVCLGVLLSGVSSHARTKDALLPILMFPLSVPLFIGAIEATAAVLRDGTLGSWFGTLCSIAVILCVVSWLLCDWVWEER